MRMWSLLVLLVLLLGGGGHAVAGGVPRVGPDQAQMLLQKPDILLLDVRTVTEHREQHIPGTDALIPVQELASRLKELEYAKKRPILVYCRSGNRSLQAAELLKKHGFQDVTDLEGGILAWDTKGYATEKGAFVPPVK